MKGFRFYAEMPAERRSKNGSKNWRPFTRAELKIGAQGGLRLNCFALYLPEDGASPWTRGDCGEGFTSVVGALNSPVCWGSATRGYLSKNCLHIDEELARKLHPELFARLDAPEPGEVREYRVICAAYDTGKSYTKAQAQRVKRELAAQHPERNFYIRKAEA